ncbi:MAG: septal ring lytic transglycosylase RlpA family protein [Caulobacterales bacterium]|nr:septal ring lytic transglycosylase RlpA family protein [Caulobacterales bacterium]
MAISRNYSRTVRLALVLMAGASLAACASVQPRYSNRLDGGAKPAPGHAVPGQGVYKVGSPYQVGGVWYVPQEQPDYDQTGVASWYGDEFHEKATANGEIFDMNAVSAAHTTLPLPSIVEVTNLDNGKRLQVRVNDRGPFVGGRIIDLSHEAARQLGYDRAGLARVRVRYVGPAPLLGPDAGVRYADARPASNRPLATRLPPAPPRALAAAPAAASALSDTADIDPVMELAAGSSRKAVAGQVMKASAPQAQQVGARAFADQALPPVTGAEISDAPIAAAVTPIAAPTAVSQAELPALPTAPKPLADPLDAKTQVIAQAGPSAASPLRIQAGAFSSEANAQRAVSQLAPAGQASIEPLQRDGTTLYRVVIPAPDDEVAAYALRDRVAQIGFADARVLHSF